MDDGLLVATCPEELQCMMQELAEASMSVGLKMNLSKTKVMYNAFVQNKKIKVEDKELEEVKNYVYLGQLLTMDVKLTEEVNRE